MDFQRTASSMKMNPSIGVPFSGGGCSFLRLKIVYRSITFIGDSIPFLAFISFVCERKFGIINSREMV